MGRAFQTDRDVLGETESTADLVLGAPALLGIFFAAALLCAVCFGFGYSSGHTVRRTPLVESDETASATQPSVTARREASQTAIAAPDAGNNAPPPQDASAGTEPGFPPLETAPPTAHKPIPGAAYVPPDTDTSNAAPAKTQDLPAGRSAFTQQQYAPPRPAADAAPDDTVAPPHNAVAPVPVAPHIVVPAADTVAVPASGPALNLMVQIAAVSHAADAQTLASALRHDGFAAIVRTTTGDPFFHVQVGPFATLQAAKAMRARLAGNGYNAFIRP